MFMKFLKESYRNKVNRPLSFFINWLGLTLGFAAVIVMYLFIIGELRHDRDVYTRPMDDVYRCEVDKQMGAICPAPLADFMTNMPEVAGAVRILNQSRFTISSVGLSSNNKFKVELMMADSSLFQVLPFRVISSAGDDVLSDESKIVINRSMALKLYGTTDVVGRGVELNNAYMFQISAVIEDAPENSTWRPEVICNIKLDAKLANIDPAKLFSNWGRWFYETYYRLKPGVDPVAFEAKYSKAVQDEISKAWGGQYKETPAVRAFNDIYFSSGEVFGNAKNTDPASLRVLGLVAILILVIAIINYVNIYTARSTEVIRAMGIKAIMGGNRARLVGFVIFDSVVITLLSALSGLLLAALCEPIYPAIIGSAVSFTMSWDTILILFVGLPLLCGVLSGIFPALAMTRLKPLEAIANRGGGGAKMMAVRNILIVFQFTITIGLIASTLLINKQMRYMGDLDLGLNRDNVYVVSGDMFMKPKFEAFRSKLIANPLITNVSIMSSSPINVGNMMTINWGDTEKESETVFIIFADENALSMLGVDMVEGDSINLANKQTASMMVNQSLAQKMRLTNPDITFPFKEYIGVFQDFQFQGLTQSIRPMVVASIEHSGGKGSAYIRIGGGGDMDATLKLIETTFAEFYPNEIFEGYFLDQMFDQMFQREQLFRARLMTFSLLAIFICTLGLFALVGYSVQRRCKEIAIRKAYGSTIAQVLILLGGGFLKWLVIAFVLATPIVWWVMSGWIEQFAYRTDISWWIFAVAGAVAFVVALITVLWQTYHAATENPSRPLKGE